MIHNEAIARQIAELIGELTARLRQSVALAEGKCPEAELAAYRQAVEKLQAAFDAELLGPLYAENPALRPEGWTPAARRPAGGRSLGGIIQPV